MSEQSVDPKVLTALYSEYLNRSIQLVEENARLRVRVAELEVAGDEGAVEVDDAA